jgi:hypothetical protein
MSKKFLMVPLLILQFLCRGQEVYTLNLQPDTWKFISPVFYFSKITDERKDKDAGRALSSGKFLPVKFKSSAESDLKQVMQSLFTEDTSKIGLTLSIDRFKVNETGNVAHHLATFDFAVSIYREIEGMRYKIYEANGLPEMTVRGPYPGVQEKNIIQAFHSMAEGFGEWISQNRNNPALAKRTMVVFEEPKINSPDTIVWKPSARLQWSDFKGKPRNTNFMAESNCIFTYMAIPEVKDFTLILHIRIAACFDRNTSWVKRDQMKAELLAHEQLHFDICELNIRLLKENLKLVRMNPMEYEKPIDKLFNEAWENYQREQQNYDNETQHGLKADQQNKWEKKISEALLK